MKRKHILLTSLLLVVAFNLLLTYLMAWNPYSFYFNRPEFSEINFKTRDIYAQIAAYVNLTLLWVTVIWALIDWKRRNRFNLFAPVISGLTFWIMAEVKDYYPDAISEWTENGYQFKSQRWYLDGDKVYKRWKSRDSLKNYNDYRKIIWELDSISKE